MTITERKRLHSPSQPTGCWIRPEKRLAIYLRDGFRCVYCLVDLHDADPRDITLDHIKCQADGGDNSEGNLVTACRSCNSSRRSLPLAVYAGPETRKLIRILTRRSLRRYLRLAKALIAGEAGGKDC